jgi:hypothetical protein
MDPQSPSHRIPIQQAPHEKRYHFGPNSARGPLFKNTPQFLIPPLHTERLATHRTIETEFFGNPGALSMALRCQYLTLRAGIHYELGWLVWCEEAIGLMEA